jgi:hypothetical protein
VPRKARDVRSALLQKGFTEEKRHHCFYFLQYDGKKSSINTKISHGMVDSDISEGLLSAMAGQVRLSNPQFKDLIDCPLDGKQYVAILLAAGVKLKDDSKPEVKTKEKDQHKKRRRGK